MYDKIKMTLKPLSIISVYEIILYHFIFTEDLTF